MTTYRLLATSTFVVLVLLNGKFSLSLLSVLLLFLSVSLCTGSCLSACRKNKPKTTKIQILVCKSLPSVFICYVIQYRTYSNIHCDLWRSKLHAPFFAHRYTGSLDLSPAYHYRAYYTLCKCTILIHTTTPQIVPTNIQGKLFVRER